MLVRVGAFAALTSASVFAAALSDPAQIAGLAAVVALVVAATALMAGRRLVAVPRLVWADARIATGTPRTTSREAAVSFLTVNRR